MQDSVKRLLGVYEVLEQIALVLYVFLYEGSTTEDLFYCAPAWTEPACSSASSSSALTLSRLRIIRSIVLLG